MTRQHVEHSIVIDAPIEFCWEVLSDPQVYVEAIDWVYEARVEGGDELGPGTAYVERAKPGPKTGTYRWDITAWDPPHRQVHSHSGGELEGDLELRFEALDGTTTRYTQHMAFRAMPKFRPLGFIVERLVMKPSMEKDFRQMILPNYKRIVEERYAAGS
ncbi:MAG: SRPBCC family protein [Acidimicrobiia bacterium]|nr:SRPBCC family protein [Acidimicrobiia bacterium]